MWRCLWVSKKFSVILPKKWWWKWWYGGAGKRVWRSGEAARRGNEKEEKERNEKKGAGQKHKGELKKKEWVVGLGRAWHVGNQNLTLTFFFFFLMLTETLQLLYWTRFHTQGFKENLLISLSFTIDMVEYYSHKRKYVGGRRVTLSREEKNSVIVQRERERERERESN